MTLTNIQTQKLVNLFTMFADLELFLEHIYHFMFEWLEFVKGLIKLYLLLNTSCIEYLRILIDGLQGCM